MSRKKFWLDRIGDSFSGSSPLCSLLWRRLASLSMLMRFCADGDDAVEFQRAASEPVALKATMVLSEAHGLWLFLVIREGITCNG